MKLPVWTTNTKLPFTLFSKPEATVLNKEWVSVGLTFGDPRKNCSGSGICHVMGAGELKPPSCYGVRVNGFLAKVDDRHLQVVFDVRQLSFQEKKQYFRGAKMMVRTNLALPFDIKRALGVSERAVISPGEYVVSQDGYYLHHYVRFKNLLETSS